MEHPNPERKWQNMRRMAWISLVASLCYPIMYLFTDADLRDLTTPFYLFTGSVVGAYMGFSTWGDKR